MLKIEIFPDDVKLNTRAIPPKDGKPGRTLHEQVAYVHLGGKFPVQMKLQVDEAMPYVAGTYTVDSSSFMVNNFGGLELRRFGMKIVPLAQGIKE
ncbi:single-stranded DNA-binding protein [Shewanella sp.]|uniref:single-stranded DNA-binding protein n=1 Tax=Shewanella sp. TaxID=50422 RepID=UPI000ED98A73|nr:single-stranded DNA-binding protein [Shewanella sp.]HCD12817.1 hypothetical protein [Shewanella sp.]